MKLKIRFDLRHWLLGVNWNLGHDFPMGDIPFVAVHLGPVIVLFSPD